MTDTFTVGLVQMRCEADAETNLNRAVAAVRKAADSGAQIVCLQELFRTPYFCQRQDPALFDLAESIPSPSTELLGRVARETHCAIVASLFERRAAGVYHNTAVVLDADGSLKGMYRKMHIPDEPLSCEKYYFSPGDLGFRAIETRYARVGVLISWDQWFPEAARLTGLQGAEVLLCPAAIGWHPAEKEEFGEGQHEAWELIQRGHAITNGVFVAAVNRVGHEKLDGLGLEFWGQSFVSDPYGGILGRASAEREEVLVVECARRRIEEARRGWPFLRDRRIDYYEGLTRRFLDGAH